MKAILLLTLAVLAVSASRVHVSVIIFRGSGFQFFFFIGDAQKPGIDG